MASISFKLEGEWSRYQRSTGNLQRNLAKSAIRIHQDERRYIQRTIMPRIMMGINASVDPFTNGRRRITRVLYQQTGPLTMAVGVFVDWQRLRPEFAKGSPFWQTLNRKQQRRMFGLFLKHNITKNGGDYSKLTMFDPLPYIEPVFAEGMNYNDFYGRAQVSWQRSASRIW